MSIRPLACLLAATVAVAAAAPAFALPVVSPTGITLGVTGGTLGVGPEVAYRFNPLLSVRGSATFLGFGGHGTVAGYRYDGHLRLRNFGGTIDFNLPLSGFRLSAGVRSTNGNRIRFTGKSQGNRTFGNVTFTPDQAGTLSGTIHTRDISPLATVGYSHASLTGLTFGFDAGVMFQGRPRVEDIVATGQLATNPLAQADRLNAQARLQDKVSDYRYFPVAQLSLGYRF